MDGKRTLSGRGEKEKELTSGTLSDMGESEDR